MRDVSRNNALVFAEYALKNLEFIEKAFSDDADVHVVTQLACSLLGLIVFPQEKHFVDTVASLTLGELVRKGWPQWEISVGTCETLGKLVWHLRNAVPHGRMTFSSDSRHMGGVLIFVEDFDPRNPQKTRWSAQIGATDLRKFCLKFIQLLNDTIG